MDASTNRSGTALDPTGFQRALAAHLRTREPRLFAWYGSGVAEDARRAQLELDLLRSSYRLSTDVHERAYRLAARAAERVGVTQPIRLYQSEDPRMTNAGMCFAPDVVHIVLSGPILTALDDDELLALFGHELAHHRYLSMDEGTFHTTTELVEACAAKAGTGPFVATAIRHRRWTEIVADRGAVLACGAIEPAIACLVKVATGLSEVSIADYLAQAREVVRRMDRAALASEIGTHPLTAIRAVALEAHRDDPATADERIAELVDGPPELEALDLLQQVALERTTRALIDRMLAPRFMRTDAVVAHRRAYFAAAEPAPIDLGTRMRSPSVDDYLVYVLLDFVVVDRSIGEPALAQAFVVAEAIGLADRFAVLAKKELSMSAAAITSASKKAAGLVAEAERQAIQSDTESP